MSQYIKDSYSVYARIPIRTSYLAAIDVTVYIFFICAGCVLTATSCVIARGSLEKIRCLTGSPISEVRRTCKINAECTISSYIQLGAIIPYKASTKPDSSTNLVYRCLIRELFSTRRR